MKILVFNHYAKSDAFATGTRHFDLAGHVRAHGSEMEIVCASFDSVTGEQKISFPNVLKREEERGVVFHYIWCPQYSGNGLARWANMMCFSLLSALFFMCRRNAGFDVVIGSSVHPFAALSGWLVALRWRARFVYEVRDLWPETLVQFGRLNERSLVAKLCYFLDGFLARMSESVISPLPLANAFYKQKYKLEVKFLWLPNSISPKRVNTRTDGSQVSPGPGVSIGYIGAIGVANNLKTVLKAFRIAQEQCLAVGTRCSLTIIGAGPEKEQLVGLSKALGIRDLCFQPPIPKSAVASTLEAFDILTLAVAPLPSLYQYGIGMNKIYDYMCSGRPVAMAVSASNNPVSESDCGLVSAAGDAKALSESYVDLSVMSAQRRAEIGARGREHAFARYGSDVIAGELIRFLASE